MKRKKNKFKYVLALSMLIISLTLCGCDGMIKSDKVSFKSIFSGETITLYVSADKYDQGGKNGGSAFYCTKLSKDEILAEIENNEGVEIKNLCGYNFFTVANDNGIYYISIEKSDRKRYAYQVRLTDMQCDFRDNDGVYFHIPFPYFLFESAVKRNEELAVDKEIFVKLIDELGIYEINKTENHIALKFKQTTLNIQLTENGIIIKI